MRRTAQRLGLVFLTMILIATVAMSGSTVYAQDDDGAPTFHDAVGSWFGRAVPIPGQTICPAGFAGCPVPLEIVMVFTVNADGTFIGIDSNIFSGATHSTAHGAWEKETARSIKAEFTLLQSSPTGFFIGGFKNLFNATMVTRDEMHGAIDARLYSYTTATGEVIVGPDGLPTPSPLAPASECSTTPGCTHLGKFSFVAKRVKVQE